MSKISVIIPAYNVEKYIEEAVRSAIVLPVSGEVLVVDDGSKDSTPDIVKSLQSEYDNLTLLTHRDNKNHGAGASRNLGIRNAKYDYISFLDGDDLYLENRFQKSLPILLNNPEVDGVYEATETFFENEELEKEWTERHGSKIITMHREIPPKDVLRYLTFGGNGHFSSNSILLRKSVFDRSGYFSEELLVGQDTEMWLRISAKCNLLPGNIAEPVCLYRIHSDNRARKKTGKEYSKVRLDIFESLVKWMDKEDIALKKKMIIFQKYIENYSLYRYGNRGAFSKILYDKLVFLSHGIPAKPILGSLSFFRYLAAIFRRFISLILS
jgi:glycosyltransferase involved in cell wall biosynthesis